MTIYCNETLNSSVNAAQPTSVVESTTEKQLKDISTFMTCCCRFLILDHGCIDVRKAKKVRLKLIEPQKDQRKETES